MRATLGQTKRDNDTITVIRRFQGLRHRQWKLLLGHPRTGIPIAQLLEPWLVTLPRGRADQAREAFAAWRDAMAKLAPGTLTSARRFVRATEDLAQTLPRVDRLGVRLATASALVSRATPLRRATLTRIASEAVELRNDVIARYMPLVHAVARGRGVSEHRKADLVHEAVFGLIRAIELFDADRGTQFATYARYWIRASLADASGPTATDALLQVRCGSTGDLDLAAPLVDPVDAIDQRGSLSVLSAAVDELPSRERLVVLHRYELSGRSRRSLRDLATELDVSPQRVNQLERRAIERLRSSLLDWIPADDCGPTSLDRRGALPT